MAVTVATNTIAGTLAPLVRIAAAVGRVATDDMPEENLAVACLWSWRWLVVLNTAHVLRRSLALHRDQPIRHPS